SFESYLSVGGAELQAARKAEVEDKIVQLRQRVATVQIKVIVEDADIAIDDVRIGKSPLTKPVLLNAGRHKITASKKGYEPDTKQAPVAGADQTEVQLELTESGARGEPPPPAVAPEPPAPQPKALPPPRDEVPEKRKSYWIGWAVTGTFAAGAAVFGVLA